MAGRTTTLGLENLESRLNLSSLVGAAVIDSFTAGIRSQERATLRNRSRLIKLNTNSGTARNAAVAKAAKPLTTSPLVAANADSSAPDLTLTSTTKNVSILWTNNAQNATGFRIERSTDGINFTSIATVSATRTSFTDSKVVAGTNYTYQVVVFNKNDSATGNPATTALIPPPPPVAPTLLTDAKNTVSSVKLTWHDNANNETGFEIFRSTGGSDFTLLTTLKANSKTFTDTNLDSDTQYVYEIAAVNAGGQTFADGNVAATTLSPSITAPVSLAFSNINSSAVNLTWTDPSTSVSGFRVYRSNNGSPFTLVGNVESNSDTFTDTNLTASTKYTYKVSAWNDSYNVFSKTLSASTLAAAPNAPSTPAFTNVTSTSLTLSWTPTSANQTGFNVYRSTDGANFTLVATTAANVDTFNDQNLTSGGTYWYNVSAFNPGGAAASSTVSTSTIAENINNQSAQTPSTPANLAITNVSTSSLTLNWTEANSANATGIHVYRSTNGGTFTLVGTLDANATTWNDSALASNTQYSYEVAAYNTAGEVTSAAAATSTLIAAPNTPSTPTFTNVTTSSLTLNWTEANSANATGIHIYRSTNGGTFTLVGTLAATATTWNDSALVANTQYSYEVAAYNTAGEVTSAAAATSTLIAVPNTPSTPTFTNVTTSSLTLNWTEANSTNATGIHIYRSTNGGTFTLVGTLAATATTWNDSLLAANTQYSYEVAAYNTAGETKSVAANTTTLAPAVSSNPVAFSTQNMTSFTELDITGTTSNDSIVVSQSNGILDIVANGQTYTYANTFGDLKIFGVNGNDTITVQSSVNIATLIYGGNGNDVINNLTTGKATIVTIGNGVNTVTGNGINTAFWVNTSDTVNATAAEIALGGVNRVNNFYQPFSTNTTAANYIPRSLNGQNLPDPTDAGTEIRLNNSSLWGTGPSINDINQTSIADCYFLAPLASLAFSEPQKLMNMGVDLGDGTYAFRFIRNGVTSYVRVDGDLSAGGWDYGLADATPGADGNEWGSLFEKAYAFFRTPTASNANTFASLNYGFQGSTYSDLGLSSSSMIPSITPSTTAMNTINNALAASHGVVASTNGSIAAGVNIVPSHVYTVVGAYTNSSGTVMVQLRNPWGVDGFNDDSNPNDGLVTISYATFAANFNMLNYTNA